MAKDTLFWVFIANSHADIRATISARTAVWTIPDKTPHDNGCMFWLDNVPTATPHDASLLIGLVGARQPPSVNIQIGSFPAWKGSCSTVFGSSADSSFWKLLNDGGSGIHPWTHTAKSRPLISWICSSVRCSLHFWKVLHSQWRCSWLSGSPQCLQFEWVSLFCLAKYSWVKNVPFKDVRNKACSSADHFCMPLVVMIGHVWCNPWRVFLCAHSLQTECRRELQTAPMSV